LNISTDYRDASHRNPPNPAKTGSAASATPLYVPEESEVIPGAPPNSPVDVEGGFRPGSLEPPSLNFSKLTWERATYVDPRAPILADPTRDK
jgi:hypothetical protein